MGGDRAAEPLRGGGRWAGPRERNEVSKESSEQIIRKVSDKVVSGYRKEGLPPPANGEVPAGQHAKIQKLVADYVKFYQAQGA